MNTQQNDKLIREIKSCNTELELCKKIEGFMGTFLRLAKNYKEHGNYIEPLEKLYRRVELVIV
jgi:hypothetical protein